MGNLRKDTLPLPESYVDCRDAFDEGRMFVAPCALGDTLYMVVCKSKLMFDHRYDTWFAYVKPTKLRHSNFFRVLEEYGKTVFSSKAFAQVCADALNKEAMSGAYEKETTEKFRSMR